MSAQGQSAGASPSELGRRLAAGDRTAAPAALNLIEARGHASAVQTAELLSELSPTKLGGEAPGRLIGVTGPPGAGKSTLMSELIATWRERGQTVAVLAVDPSSKRSGGALLGDRARMRLEPGDDGALIRSTATATRLGGLAPSTRESALALLSAFDLVVVETVGVGQSETDIAELADTVVVVVQPASGDVLQFLKAGVMEVPDILVVTKADLGPLALRAQRDLKAALGALGESTPVLAVASLPPAQGIAELADAITAHADSVDVHVRRAGARRLAALAAFISEHGEKGLRKLGGRRTAVKLLAEQDSQLGTHSLLSVLEAAAN